VLGQGPALVNRVGNGLRVGQPRADLGGFGLGGAGQFLGHSAIGTSLTLSLNPVCINVSDQWGRVFVENKVGLGDADLLGAHDLAG
jgi:hypothetical protein